MFQENDLFMNWKGHVFAAQAIYYVELFKTRGLVMGQYFVNTACVMNSFCYLLPRCANRPAVQMACFFKCQIHFRLNNTCVVREMSSMQTM